ncbi:MAG: response regulator [Methylocystaceae bacterium]
MPEYIKVVIADDHALVRDGMAKLMELNKMIEVVAVAGNGEEAIECCRRTLPDLVLMDVNMPGVNGVQATRVIKREMPQVKIIAVTVYEDEQVVEMVKAGVSAYVLKDVPGEELMSTILKVMEGNVVIHPRVANRVIKELNRVDQRRPEFQLTRRERVILECLVKGLANKEMAAAMDISEKTVKNHLTSIFRKLDVKDRTQAAVFAIKNGLVSVD